MGGVAIEGGRFAVTGGAGFVGSHVADALLAAGAAGVRILDVSDGEDNLTGALGDPRAELLQGDVRDPALLARLVDGANGVFHLATMPLGACIGDPVPCAQVNVGATMDLIAAARGAGVTRIVFSSASSVYGETDEPTDESFPLRPSNLYGESKVAGELLLRRAAAAGGPEWMALRYMNVYGPRQRGGLIPAVLRSVRAGTPPRVSGDGSARFDFVHVSDVAGANLRAMAGDVSGLVLNIGSGTSASVLEIAGLLCELAGNGLRPEVEGGPPGLGRRGRIELAEETLGWRPQVSLRDGLADLVGRAT